MFIESELIKRQLKKECLKRLDLATKISFFLWREKN